MAKREVTIETRLQLNNPLVTYINDYVTEYSKVKREIWQELTDKNHNTRFKSLADYKKYCRGHYNLLGRTINSLIFEVQGIMNSYMELKKIELQSLDIKIANKKKKIAKLKVELDILKYEVARNFRMEVNLHKYHAKKQSLYYQQNKLNKMMQQRDNLDYQITNAIYSLCFGSKELFSKQYRLRENGFKSHLGWYNSFVKNRDKNILYVGSSNETFGNQMFQMTYDRNTDKFTIKLRKEDKYCKSVEDKYIILDNIDFKYRRNELKSIIKAYAIKSDVKVPLTYRLHREDNKWYLQVIFSIEFDADYDCKTTNKYGTIGLDYNDGFIEVTETNASGNPIKQKRYDLIYHGTGNKAKTEIQQVVSKIVTYAEQYGKDIIIENLDFKKTKALQDKATNFKDKNYNRMLHKFDYSRYKETLSNICFNHRVHLQMINPKNTSKVGKEKYATIRKMTIHQAASFVIARKGQGFDDTIKKLS